MLGISIHEKRELAGVSSEVPRYPSATFGSCITSEIYRNVPNDSQVRDILSGLLYLHQSKIVHGDLKAVGSSVRMTMFWLPK